MPRFEAALRRFDPRCSRAKWARITLGSPTRADRVLPDVPVRQYVLSLPYELRRVAAFKADALTVLGRVFVEAVFASYRRRAARQGIAVPVVPFGEADLVWRRAFADGREEIGLRWSHVTVEAAAPFFTSHGYVDEADDSALGRLQGAGARRWSRANPPARARLRGTSAVWWSGER
jgi:hypothetical protein